MRLLRLVFINITPNILTYIKKCLKETKVCSKPFKYTICGILVDVMIIAVEESQDGSSDDFPIMLQMRLFVRLRDLPPILLTNDSCVLAQLDLSPHHVLIEAQMTLRAKESISNVQPLDRGVVR